MFPKVSLGAGEHGKQHAEEARHLPGGPRRQGVEREAPDDDQEASEAAEEILRLVEQSFPVKIYARGSSLSVRGDDERLIKKLENLLVQYAELSLSGHKFNSAEIRYGLHSIQKGEEVRVFPLSNWTEADIWEYIERENIEIPSLYFAKVRPVVYRDGNIIMVDDDRMKLRPGEKIEMKSVRFRTLGCYPLTGGVESTADTLPEIIEETLSAVSSERTTRVIDNEAAGSMERRKREGYF